jgi:IS4 transposase
MISGETIRQLQDADRDIRFILGARMRRVKEVRDKVLSSPGRYREVYGPRQNRKDPAPLNVKEVWIEKRRYIVCYNEEQAKKDRADREVIVEALKEQLKKGAKSLVGNKGFRKYLRVYKNSFAIDEEKLKREQRYDGKWVLQTDMECPAGDIALRYKELLMVEQIFRSMKTILETRPIYHKTTQSIRGHVFCSFLALILLKELQDRMHKRGWKSEWAQVCEELNDLEEFTVGTPGKKFVIRSRVGTEAGKAIQSAGVALGPIVRFQNP